MLSRARLWGEPPPHCNPLYPLGSQPHQKDPGFRCCLGPRAGLGVPAGPTAVGRKRCFTHPDAPRMPMVWLQWCSLTSVWPLACKWVRKASGKWQRQGGTSLLPSICAVQTAIAETSTEEQPGSELLLAQRDAPLRTSAIAHVGLQLARASLPFIHLSSGPNGIFPSLAWHCDTAKISCQSQHLTEWRVG